MCRLLMELRVTVGRPSNSDWVFIQEMIDERGRSSKINARMGITRPHPQLVIHLIDGEIH